MSSVADLVASSTAQGSSGKAPSTATAADIIDSITAISTASVSGVTSTYAAAVSHTAGDLAGSGPLSGGYASAGDLVDDIATTVTPFVAAAFDSSKMIAIGSTGLSAADASGDTQTFFGGDLQNLGVWSTGVTGALDLTATITETTVGSGFGADLALGILMAAPGFPPLATQHDNPLIAGDTPASASVAADFGSGGQSYAAIEAHSLPWLAQHRAAQAFGWTCPGLAGVFRGVRP